jgi:hypothetical protein
MGRPGNEARKLRAEVERAHRAGYEEGCAATTLLAYQAIGSDYGLDGIQWLSDRISAAVAKKSPPHSTAIDTLVTASVIGHMKHYTPTRAAEIETAFKKFLAGESK